MATKTKKLILLDTNIVIGLLRGEKQESQIVESLGYENTAISTISVLEIYYGMFKSEVKDTKIAPSKFNKLHLDKEICQKAVEIMLAYASNRPMLPDCLIAATSIICNAELYTYNKKDFDYLKGVNLYAPKIFLN